MIGRVIQLGMSNEIDGTNLKKLASSRTTRTDTISALRGSIYSSNGDVLAQNVSSYKLIAYLDKKRTTNKKKPQHVVDKEDTATKLAPILGMEKDEVLRYLNKENVYQTEFGNKGRGLNEITKDKIKALNLPGIDFIETTKRYYPYGDFASYLVGYAKEQADGTLKGELGVESIYNNELTLIEVKASNGNAKSLKEILENKQKYNVDTGIKLIDGNVGNAKNILTVPLYMSFLLD
jgi:penicillin-binding protein 2B